MDYGEAMARGRCNANVAVAGGDDDLRPRLTAAWTTAAAAAAAAAVGKDASATTATTQVRLGHWARAQRWQRRQCSHEL